MTCIISFDIADINVSWWGGYSSCIEAGRRELYQAHCNHITRSWELFRRVRGVQVPRGETDKKNMTEKTWIFASEKSTTTKHSRIPGVRHITLNIRGKPSVPFIIYTHKTNKLYAVKQPAIQYLILALKNCTKCFCLFIFLPKVLNKFQTSGSICICGYFHSLLSMVDRSPRKQMLAISNATRDAKDT